MSRPFHFFLAAVLMTLLLMTFQAKFGPIRPFAFLPAALNRANDSIDSFFVALADARRMVLLNEEELVRLRQENRLLKFSQMRTSTIEAENQRLNTMLGLAQNTPSVTAVAHVVSLGNVKDFRSVIVDKGEGVRKDMAVVAPGGLYGKVHRAGESFSEVVLLDEPRFSVAVRTGRGRAEGVFTGDGAGRGELKYMVSERPVELGDTIETSGLDGVFPAGIPVGYVSAAETDERGMFQSIEVRTFVETDRVEEVLIITR